eukprot:COSAG05_NODE_1758_length_4138_cov_1092.842783_4_plen_86_part_00
MDEGSDSIRFMSPIVSILWYKLKGLRLMLHTLGIFDSYNVDKIRNMSSLEGHSSLKKYDTHNNYITTFTVTSPLSLLITRLAPPG